MPLPMRAPSSRDHGDRRGSRTVGTAAFPAPPASRVGAAVRAAVLLLATAAVVPTSGCSDRVRQPPPPAPETFPENELGGIPAEDDLDSLLSARPIGDAPGRLDLLAFTPERSYHLAQVRTVLPRHYHATHTERARVLRGRGTVEIEGRTYPGVPGSSFLVRPGLPHSVEAEPGQVLVALVVFEPPMRTGNEDRVLVDD